MLIFSIWNPRSLQELEKYVYNEVYLVHGVSGVFIGFWTKLEKEKDLKTRMGVGHGVLHMEHAVFLAVFGPCNFLGQFQRRNTPCSFIIRNFIVVSTQKL